MNISEKSTAIAAINDRFRRGLGLLPRIPGQLVQTSGITALPQELQLEIWSRVRRFETFTEANDPYGEHDFGAFDAEGAGKIFWKIDYYADAFCEWGSENPEDLEKSFRVLTVMLAGEW